MLIVAVPSEDGFMQHCVNGILNMPPHHISRFSDLALQNIANIFSLKLIKIYHENVQGMQISDYQSIMWAKRFLKTPLIDRSLKRKIINRLGRVGKYCIKIPKNAYGHTVVAVYAK